MEGGDDTSSQFCQIRALYLTSPLLIRMVHAQPHEPEHHGTGSILPLTGLVCLMKSHPQAGHGWLRAFINKLNCDVLLNDNP